jgi:hypothetical protein
MASFEDIARQRPANAEEALAAVDLGLEFFHRTSDYRAVFLRAYRIITVNLLSALERHGRFDNPVFWSGEWIRRIAGRFASRYFASLDEARRDGRGQRAWRIAHGRAAARRTSVSQDLLLGINAHINHDLALATADNLREFGGIDQLAALARRKFDHDQVNNVLRGSFDEIAEAIPRAYGGLIGVAHAALYRLDDRFGAAGIAHFRERAWHNALAHVAAADEAERQLVVDRLDWESAQVAKDLVGDGAWCVRAAHRAFALFRRRDLRGVRL